MNKKFLIIPAILMALAAGLATSALAQRPGHHGGWMLKRMTKQLNLTDAQQTQIKGIMAGEKPKIQPLMQQLRQNQQAQNANINGNIGFSGALYFPGATLTLGGTVNSGYAIIIGDVIDFTGNVNIGSDFSSLSSGSPIKAAVLVQ